jgi:tRNA G18 (ribose-2'-O)-methylase SpoU
VERHETTTDGIASLKKKGYQIFVSDLSPGAVSLFELDPLIQKLDTPICFMFGNEKDGISDEVR